jgi:hypothetical protein
MHDARDLADLVPRDSGDRIEIDTQLVWMVEVIGTNRVRVQLEAREVRHPQERTGIAGHDLFRAAARGKTQCDRGARF